MEIDAIDLFAGAGGTTEGAESAGIRVRWAANHNPAAVETHRRNHPKVEVSCQDLKQANFLGVPRTKIVYASPECRGHARARGSDKPHHDDSRATAYAVLSCVEAVVPDIIIVENVVEFRNWGPRDRTTLRPIPSLKGYYYEQWCKNLEGSGYRLSENIINAADLGVPQNRVRLFVVGVHRDLSDSPVEIPQPNRPRRPARDVLDFSLPMEKITDRRLCETTRHKIQLGRFRLGDDFLIQYNGTSGPQSIDKPMGSVTTRDRFGLVRGDFYRMVTLNEYRAAMGFREDYILPEDKTVALKMLGNAVAPPVARYVSEQVVAKVYRRARAA